MAGGSVPLASDPPSYRNLVRKVKALLGDGIQLNGGKLRFGMQSDGHYNPYLDLTIIPHNEAGLPLSPSSMRDNDMVLVVTGNDVFPGNVKKKGRSLFVELPWEMDTGQRFFVLDEGAKGILTVSLEGDGSDNIRVVPPVALASWLSTECPVMAPKYAMEDGTVRCPDGKRLRIADERTLTNEDIGSLGRNGLSGLLGKYRLRRVRECPG